MAVRTKQLYIGRLALASATKHVLYSVPAGFRTIVKSVQVIKTTPGSAGNCSIHVANNSPPQETLWSYFDNLVILTGDRFLNDVWHVLEDTNHIYGIQTSTLNGSPNVIISGAELAL